MTRSDLTEFGDTLYLGMTRPAMKGGVSYKYMVVIIIASMEVFLNVGLIAGAGVFLIMWAFGIYIFKDDYFTIDILYIKWLRFPLVRNHSLWKANSYLPY